MANQKRTNLMANQKRTNLIGGFGKYNLMNLMDNARVIMDNRIKEKK